MRKDTRYIYKVKSRQERDLKLARCTAEEMWQTTMGNDLKLQTHLHLSSTLTAQMKITCCQYLKIILKIMKL